MSRKVYVVDVETTGLLEHHVPVEIAFWCLDDGTRGRFIPGFDATDLAAASPDAMRITRFYERGLHLEQRDVHGFQLLAFHELMHKNVLAGSKPTFDAEMISRMFVRFGLRPDPWHYRLLDVGQYAQGVLGLPLAHTPGLARICSLLGIAGGDHSAEADVTATGLAFLKLQEIAQSRKAA